MALFQAKPSCLQCERLHFNPQEQEVKMANPKLNQILAIEKGVKKLDYADLSKAHHVLQKTTLFNGHNRTYAPVDEDGVVYPQDINPVQMNASVLVSEVKSQLNELFNVIATKDFGNTLAKADIVLDPDGENPETLAKDVPTSYLLFLEKQLTDLRTFVRKLPVLDPAKQWKYQPNIGMYESKPEIELKKIKVPTPIVLFPATPEHPAQTKLESLDKLEGRWTKTLHSSAFPADEIKRLERNISALEKAVKFAREKANETVVARQNIGDKLLEFVFENGK